MNKRINELAEQVGLLGPRSRVGNAHEAAEKFAELIVQECINVSLKSSHRYDDMGAIIASDIAEHFGVEK